MKIEEAIVYVLAERNGGLKTEQIAEIINGKKILVLAGKAKPKVIREDKLNDMLINK